MATPFATRIETAAAALIRDYGYHVADDRLIQRRVGTWFPETVHRCRVRGNFDAAEMLCPIIAEPEFTKRLIALSKPTK